MSSLSLPDTEAAYTAQEQADIELLRALVRPLLEDAEELLEATDGREVETGYTYTTEDGTYWAYVLEDGRGRYVWTTDRGHVLQVTGSTDHVSGFYSNFPL